MRQRGEQPASPLGHAVKINIYLPRALASTRLYQNRDSPHTSVLNLPDSTHVDDLFTNTLERMAVLSLPLSFTNSFWSQDYRRGLEVLFNKLEQVRVHSHSVDNLL